MSSLEFTPLAEFSIPVPVERALSKTLWLNSLYDTSLQHLLKELQERLPLENDNDSIGIKVKLFPETFATTQAWERYQKSITYLTQEKFFDPYDPTYGPGRNATLAGCQYKGIGRTMAASRTDWQHSWGGMSWVELLSEVFVHLYLLRHAPLSLVPIFGAFSFTNESFGFLIRSSDVIRCAQIHQDFSIKTKAEICQYLERRLPSVPSHQWFNTIIERFVELCRKGIFHDSPTPQNITLDGRFIDNHSIEFPHPQSQFHFHAVITIPEGYSKPSGTDLGAAIQWLQSHPRLHVTTHLDRLYRQCLAVSEAFSRLGVPSFSSDEIWDFIGAEFPEQKQLTGDINSRSTLFANYLESNFSTAQIHLDVSEYQQMRMSNTPLGHRLSVKKFNRVTSYHLHSKQPMTSESFQAALALMDDWLA